MKEETKAVLETLVKRKIDETDAKVYKVLIEFGGSEEKQHPIKFSLDFGKKCFEMGKNESKM